MRVFGVKEEVVGGQVQIAAVQKQQSHRNKARIDGMMHRRILRISGLQHISVRYCTAFHAMPRESSPPWGGGAGV